MLQTMLSMSSGATKDTVAACQAVSETLEVSLPSSQNKSTLQEEIAIKLAGAADVVRSVRGEVEPACVGLVGSGSGTGPNFLRARALLVLVVATLKDCI